MKINFLKNCAGICVIVMTLIGLASCSSDIPKGNDEYVPIQLSAAQTRAVDASSNFALKLGAALQEGHEYENLFYSPLSAHVALSMLANGADGETLQEMLDVLADGASLEDLNALNSSIIDQLKLADRKVTFRSANAIWMDKSMGVKQSFMDAVGNNYGASLFEVARLASAVPEINSWISKNTQGMIPKFIEDNKIIASMFLASAAYFKGDWRQPFDPKDTYKGEFYNAGETTPVMVDMMTVENPQWCFSFFGGSFQGYALPYGNRAFSMLLLFDVTDSDKPFLIADLLQNGSYKTFMKSYNDHFESSMRNPDYGDEGVRRLTIPKFRLDMRYTLNDALKATGIKSLFETPNLMRLTNASIENLSCIQQSTININEAGSEVATATGAAFPSMPGIVMPPEEILLNRPFGFLIVENSTGVILFAGAVNKL